MIQAIVERWNNADGSVDYLWSLWRDGRRVHMGGPSRSSESAAAEAAAFCRESLGCEPDELREL